MAAGRKARYGGRPFWLLEILCVDPAAQGLGVGKALLAWGFERADRDRLPIYLEATKAGKPVYERAHFETVGDIVFPGGQVGTELSLPAMERPPQAIASPAGTSKAASTAAADDIIISPVEDSDWPEVMRTKLLAMEGDPRNDTGSPIAQRPDFETQVSACPPFRQSPCVRPPLSTVLSFLTITLPRPSEWGVYSRRRLSPEITRHFHFLKATRPSEPGRILGYAKWEKPRYPTEAADAISAPVTGAVEGVDDELEAIFAASEDRAFLKDFKTRSQTIREGYHRGAPYWYLVRHIGRSTRSMLIFGRKS
jgi:hypothetical protein